LPFQTGNCDGTNTIEDIILSDSRYQTGDTVNLQVEYECWLGYGGDSVTIWYHNGNSWSLIDSWTESELSGCDTQEGGYDGTVYASFIVTGFQGTQYIRAAEVDPEENRAGSSCPIMDWGDIDDLAFTVTGGYHPADTEEDGEVELLELIDYIESWKAGDVTLQDVMGAIVAWKG